MPEPCRRPPVHLRPAWKRKGYTIDGCIHWLVGSSPKNSFYPLWEEVGLIQGLEIIDHDEFTRIKGRDGKEFIFYCDIDRLQKHMLELAPEDAAFIKRFIADTRRMLTFDMPPGDAPELMTALDTLKMLPKMLPVMGVFRRWGRMSLGEFANRFKNPFLRETFRDLWYPDFALMGLMTTLAWLHNKAAGYPIGGSMPMSRALEKRFIDLGGVVHYDARVEKILVENNKAVGIRLQNGQEERADYVISAADGHATIFNMLEGRYVDDKIRALYDTTPLFPPIIYMGVGVKRKYEDEPHLVSGFTHLLESPINVAGQKVERLDVHIFNFDPTLAPEGKTVMTIMFPTSYEFWKELYTEKERYDAEKQETALAVLRSLEGRFPGLGRDVEMIDVATPVTFERYTGNWKASWEGWMITPKNLMARISKTLPGLEGFYMIGQWLQPGGGLPTGVMHGRHVVQMLCKRDGKKFRTATP
jgi:phytoene dehydrogenase-like protein